MTDAQEDEMAEWLKNHPEKEYRGHGQEGGCLGHPGQGHGHGR